MYVPAAGYIGLRLIRLCAEKSFSIITPDGLLYNRPPIQARISYGGQETQIEKIQFVRAAPLGFGSLGVSSLTSGSGVPIFARGDRPVPETC